MVGEDMTFRRDDRAAAGAFTLDLAPLVVLDRDDVNADEAGTNAIDGAVDLCTVRGGRLPFDSAQGKPFDCAEGKYTPERKNSEHAHHVCDSIPAAS
jgi:hypothetical protein